MSNQTFTQTRWSLADLFPSPDAPEMKAAFETLSKQVEDFEKTRDLLKPDISVGSFMVIVEKAEKIARLEYRLYGFAELWFTEDTQNQAAQTMVGRLDQLMAEYSNRTLFFNLWWKALDDANAERLMAASGDYRYWLEEMRHFKPHTLTEPEEKIINIKDVSGLNAMNMLYDSITNRYTFKVEVDGEVKELTRGELMVYARHHDPELRAKAYQELYRVYAQDGPILGQMYQAIVRNWGNEQVGLRKFSAPMAARNLINDIPDEVVDTLLEVAKENAVVFQRFFKLKAKWLGVDKLRRYDVYAPVAKSDKKFDYKDAAKIVFESFHEFDPKIADLAERVFKENHLDSEVRKGKRSGAFCSTLSPDLTPWVMLNYQGRSDDVATLAHELGHAIHSMLAEHHTLFTQHACLPLAETASTFGEMMLVDKLLSQEKDESVRRDLLFRQVDDAYATIMRQSYFAMFERTAHSLVTANSSVDEIADAYLKELQGQFGDSVDVSEEFKWEWVSIPHIYNVPFYVYAYAFGQLLVLSLYKQFKQEGESFKPRYLKILSAGGSEAPEKILKDADIDFRQRSFWQGGFDVIKDLVTQLEQLPITR
ncbi:MAG: oligoendopeptidase F [Anaerolinea sp.]|nr:oligoendopeptidase F [Anaerolinea sp.]